MARVGDSEAGTVVQKIELASDRPVWERQDAETDGQWRNFQIYIGLGRFRTLDKVAATINPAKRGRTRVVSGSLNDDSRANRWVERARAWDLHLSEIQREEQIHQAKLDIVDAIDYAKEIRNDALTDYRLLAEHIRLHLLPSVDKKGVKGKLPIISPKDLRELAQARDRLKELAKDVFFGLEQQQASRDDHLDQLDPELADLIGRVMSEHGKTHRDDA